ncbi:fungal-specific transcription factor domain-containing protein [Dactylonectria macrodidyma]|uniref:Fungal-specific transcription factor domain-containing protein n=1 Tax=Dactylonectria macrodidyma TaxID=307937 RepID=A0A9P9J0X4_9HYPO|nr:fungal-specific transcription factor domain-containing protein [Dactylonectria macrodidyma]
MAPDRGNLDHHQFHNAHQPLDSDSQLFHDTSDSHDHAALMDASRFDNFTYPYPPITHQQSLLSLADQTNVAQPADSFSQHPSHSIPAMHAHGLAFGPGRSGHRSLSRDGSDAAADRNSPLANSLADSAADEFGLASHGRADGTDLGGKIKEDKSDATPAWSELKTKAGKERKRLPLACIACRRKKIRCSGEKPACKHCLRSRIPCVYKVTTRKAAPRTDYMAMLDKRLKRMEERIIKVIPKSEQESTAAITRAVVKPAIPGTLPATKTASKKRGADEAFGPDLESWAKAPSKAMINGDDRPNTLQVQEAEDNKLLHEGFENLPSKETQEHLAEVFFDNVYGQSYHLLHKPSYMRKLKNNTLPPVLILSVCAVAARFTSNPQFDSVTPQFARGEEWASHARDICTRRYEWPNITILTCLLILGLHEFGTCQGGRSWALGGQAIRMAFALQLHKDLESDDMGRNGKPNQMSFVDREIRRRIMWACFLMDRFNSSGTDRPMFIREESIQVPLPIHEKYFQMDMSAPTETIDGEVLHPAVPNDGQLADAGGNMGVAGFMIRAVSIWGQIVIYMNQGGKELDSAAMWSPESQFAKLFNDAISFEAALPSLLKYSSDNAAIQTTEHTAPQFFFLHICIQHNILFLARSAVASCSPYREEVPHGFLSEASRKMGNAANRISNLLTDIEELKLFVSTPFAGYCAFTSTTAHILSAVSPDDEIRTIAEANLATNIRYLHKMKRYWGMFHWMLEDVRAQYRNAIDGARAGNSVNDGTTGVSILQYGDWFNRYPHGLSDAEFMDPAISRKKDKGADGVLEADAELQSVEEFISTLSPSQNNDDTRAAMAKRRSISKKQGSAGALAGQHQLETRSSGDLGGQPTPDQIGTGQQQQRRFSAALGGQTSGATGFSPLTVPHSQNPSYNNTMSPISPGNVAAFPHHAHMPAFFPPDLLAMNLAQQGNGALQPLERQLVFGGYSMDSVDGGLAGGQTLMDGVDWDSIAAGAQAGRGPQGRRGSVRNGMSGQAPGPVDGTSNFNGQDASSAWFMPFNLEPPEITQDMGFGVGNVDPFAAMFNGGGSGLATPNPLSRLQHGP